MARGSTTTVYLGSAHLESSIELAAICAELGQRALVGKTVMDDPVANPEYYRDASPAQAVADTETLIRELEGIGRASRQGIWPVVTPRFIPSCTDEVLRGLGQLAERYGAYVQTHCNEGQWEHDVVLERFGKTDPYALRDFGLLREHSLMAHCPYLTEEEGEMFAELGVAVAHCPMANSYFSSAVAPVKRFRQQGINVGLGTDISGGYSPSMYENIRQAVLVSRLLETGVDAQRPADERGLGDARISLVEALWLATAARLCACRWAPSSRGRPLTCRLSTSSAATATSQALGSLTPRPTAWPASSTWQHRTTSARSTCRAAWSATKTPSSERVEPPLPQAHHPAGC